MAQSKENNHPGLECPVCRFKIAFTMKDLLEKQSITCPSCMLVMNMNIPPEMKEKLKSLPGRS